MSLSIFPTSRGLTWTVVKQPEFSSIVQAAPSRSETRIAQAKNPIWHWTLVYDLLDDSLLSGQTYTDLQTLMGFFLAHQGQAAEFLLDDSAAITNDNYVGPGLNSDNSPNLKAQLQLVTDGTNWYSPIQRNMGGLFWEDITDLNGTLKVYANGVLQTTGYTVVGPGVAIPGYSFAGLVIQWAAQPTGPITAEFNFYFRVRFEADTQDFERFMATLWTIGGSGSQNGSGTLKLRSVRAS